MSRIYLSPPDVGAREQELLLEALASGWIAPMGPAVNAFEEDLARVTGRDHAAALSSGTGALHLALVLLGVERGDVVVTSTLTFAASANAIEYLGAEPVFLDCERASWNMDPELLVEELEQANRRNALPKAVIAVDLYGQCADYERIEAACARYEIPLIEDAAEALGATYRGRPAGSFGRFAILSFNGNKIITTSGGGALVGTDADKLEEARFLATQARDPAPHYEHSRLGYNYRMSNLLAALGRAQIESLAEKVDRRREHNHAYREALGGIEGFTFMPEAPHCRSSFWLTTLTVDPGTTGVDREAIRLQLEAADIEARPVWKPMHLQPYYAGRRVRGGQVAAELFERGLCLPSGSNLSEQDRTQVIEQVRDAVEQPLAHGPQPTSAQDP